MKKIIFLFVVALFWKNVCSANHQVRDGKAVFPLAEINGKNCYTDLECLNWTRHFESLEVAISSSVPAKDKTVLNISSVTVGKVPAIIFSSPSKSALIPELEKLKAKSDLYGDLDPDSAEAKDYAARYQWLKSYYGGLPK